MVKSAIFNLFTTFFKRKKPGILRSLKVIQANRTNKERFYFDKRLSLREQEVLDFLIQGRSYKEIAVILNISTETVKKHASNIYKKTNTHNKFELKYSVLEYTKEYSLKPNFLKLPRFSA